MLFQADTVLLCGTIEANEDKEECFEFRTGLYMYPAKFPEDTCGLTRLVFANNSCKIILFVSYRSLFFAVVTLFSR